MATTIVVGVFMLLLFLGIIVLSVVTYYLFKKKDVVMERLASIAILCFLVTLFTYIATEIINA